MRKRKKFQVNVTPEAPRTYFAFKSRGLETLLRTLRGRMRRDYGLLLGKRSRIRIYNDSLDKVLYDSRKGGRGNMKTVVFNSMDALQRIYQDPKSPFSNTRNMPVGNALFPCAPVGIECFEDLVRCGEASFIPAFFGNSDEIWVELELCASDLERIRRADDWESLRIQVDMNVGIWAHFGIYGSDDEVWVIAGKEYKCLRRKDGWTPSE